MSPSTQESLAIRGQDLPILGERIARTILTEPANRTSAEHSLQQFLDESTGPELAFHSAELKRLTAERSAERERLVESHAESRAKAKRRIERHLAKLDESERTGLSAAESVAESKLDSIERKAEASSWTADAVFEALEPRPREEFTRIREALQLSVDEIGDHAAKLERLLRNARIRARPRNDSDGTESLRAMVNPEVCLAEQLTTVRIALEQLRRRPFSLIMRNWAAHLATFLLLTFLAGWIVTAAVGPLRQADQLAPESIRALLFMQLGIVALQLGIWIYAGVQLRGYARSLMHVRVRTEAAQNHAIELAGERRTRDERFIKARYLAERQAAEDALRPKRGDVESQMLNRRAELGDELRRLRVNATAQFEAALAEVEQSATTEFEACHVKYDKLTAAESQRHESRLAEIAAVRAARSHALRERWKSARDQLFADTKSVAAIDRRLFPVWSDPSWLQFHGQESSIGCAKLGVVAIPLDAIPGALPIDPDLAWPSGSARIIHLPITLTFPTNASLLIEAGQEGREQGLALLREAVLRILTALPPGRARFTILDPVGLGESFAAFMHLADEAEFVIGERIWTDSRYIEQRLADLSEHMETVIQKYLRNEFADLDAYNQQAGEIAEPYRFLVIADFPTGLSDVAARKLASIVNSGARCGVFTIILRDTRQAVPPEVDLADIRSRSLCFGWKDGRLVVGTDLLDRFVFTPNAAPTDEFKIALLRRIARTARDSRRVEVPFSAIAPSDRDIWSQTTNKSISVALGRSGATRLQQITLGEGTSQHALIAGKTGSGKSTLFHALITNLALRYSPDEAELWLIDFKKGVEFRTYATHQLPHARAVAVESDREFGLSVLRGLDAELRRRGEIFRERSVQDLGGYRKLGVVECIPRTLLIVDEFQELFTEDDKVSEESALLLDRLVRQGRAFGIHVILGSQTLGGAYSIARATMGQMAVRIALQCNEADSQLILSDDNLAARLLSRPGEAIYNDAGGLVEGNNPFQVVWLPDDERDRMLMKVTAHCRQHPPAKRHKMIVFEGSAPAQLETNELLTASCSKRDSGVVPKVPLLWFGDAISIKDPSSVALRRQSGTNIMLIGQREDSALDLSAGVLVSLAAQFRSGACSLYLLDGTPPDDEHFGRLKGLQEQLGISGESGGLRDTQAVLERVTAEMIRRQVDHASQAPTCVVLVHAIHRFRSLRRNEDDFSYSSNSDAVPTPDKLLTTLLRDGPPLGIHVMVTCDGATNLARSFDRNSIREFEWRMLFQVSASDSSTLIDSPVASRLGAQRVLLHSEESGGQEKFRPYAWPDNQWIEQRLVTRPT